MKYDIIKLGDIVKSMLNQTTIYDWNYENEINEELKDRNYVATRYLNDIRKFIENPVDLRLLTNSDLINFISSKNGLFIKYFNAAIKNGKIKIRDIIKYSEFMSAKPLIESHFKDPGNYVNLDLYFARSHIFKFIRNWTIEQQKELISIDVNYVLNYIEDKYQIVNNSKECEYELTELLKSIYPEKFNELKPLLDYIINSKVMPYELKILFNKQIVLSNDIKDIEKFIKDSIIDRIGPNSNLDVNNKLAFLIENAYGKRASDVIKSRPKLNVETINSLEVFDNRILNNFGESFVHELISYNVPNFSRFLLIIKDPLALIKFTDYYNFIASYYGFDISIFEYALSSYFSNEQLLKNISINLLTNDDKNELIEYIMNYHRITYIYTNQENLFGTRKVNNIRDVKEYNNEFKLSCWEFIAHYDCKSIEAKMCNYRDFKEILSNYFFNMNYGTGDNSGEELDTNINQSLEFNMKIYGEIKLNDLTKEEKEILYVAKLICQMIKDYNYFDVVKKLIEEIEPFSISIVNSLFNKLRKKYIGELNNKLLSPEKLNQIVIDDVKVCVLSGEEFCISIHNVGNPNSNLLLQDAKGMFYSYEGQAGTSTISTFIVDSNKIEPIIGTYFGFSQIKEDEFLCIGGSNDGGAHITHYPKTINPKSVVEKRDKMELSLYRRNRNYKERNDDGRRKISYICKVFEEFNKIELSSLDIAMAKQYNVPIVIIDKSKYKKENKEMNNNKIL